MNTLVLLALKRLIRQLKANLASATSLADFKTSMAIDLADMQQDFINLQAALADTQNPQNVITIIRSIAAK